MTEVQRRRICWPKPDATCLEGGCLYCEDYPLRDFEAIQDYAREAGVLKNRGLGEKQAWTAWMNGLGNDFYGRIEVVTVDRKRR